MSIHLETVPLPIDRIANALYIEEINGSTYGMDFRAQSEVTDLNMLQEILETSLLGFKNKRSLEDFNNRGAMFFYYVNGRIEIAFLGNFPKRETIQFLENINREYFIRTNQLYRLQNFNKQEEIVEPKKEHIKEPVKKKEKEDFVHIETHQNTEDITDDEVEEVFEKVVEEVVEPPKRLVVSTNMKNIDYLEEVRKESYLGYNSKEELERFTNIGEILPSLNTNATYDIVFVGDYDEREAKEYVKNLQDEYALKVQEKTYEHLLEKIRENDYSLESEMIDNEDSIVLTLNID